MINEIGINMQLLKRYKQILSKQQYKTFKGQILAGDYEGFKKGLYKIANGH